MRWGDRTAFGALARIGHLGLVVAGSLGLAAWGGVAFDRRFGTTPWGLLACLLLALLGASLYVGRLLIAIAREEDEKSSKDRGGKDAGRG